LRDGISPEMARMLTDMNSAHSWWTRCPPECSRRARRAWR